MRSCHIPLSANSKSARKNADEHGMESNTLGMDRAALQHNHVAMARAPRRPLWTERPAWPNAAGQTPSMTQPQSQTKPSEFFIQGVTLDGQPFRPSDWAERLAGAMSCFRPDGVQGGIGAFIGYSPLCVPRLINGVKCVIVSEALKGVEPMAWDFVMNFARDNRLVLTEACLISDASEAHGKS
jgi:Protein of unknown function (DUF3579)